MSGWNGSTRKSRLPADWQSRRARVLRRDQWCRISAPGCTGRSTEVDHIRRGDNHEDGNLQGACQSCHFAKTLAERTADRHRPPEKHPGLRS